MQEKINSVACIFQYHVFQTSTLKNIFFSTLYYANDLKEKGTEKVFTHIIRELNQLSSRGLYIDPDKNGKGRIIFFQLGLIIGDNLSLNKILGFVQSFSSNSPCRICQASISEIRTFTLENSKLTRNRENYANDVKLKNFSVTGIHEPSVFDKVENYNTIENPHLDFLHDWLEGTINVTMVHIINDFIYEFKMFTLEELNLAIKEFEDLNVGISNEIPEIKKEHIRVKKD